MDDTPITDWDARSILRKKRDGYIQMVKAIDRLLCTCTRKDATGGPHHVTCPSATEAGCPACADRDAMREPRYAHTLKEGCTNQAKGES